MSETTYHDQAINEYLLAFRRAHGKEPPFRLVYRAGWFEFQSPHIDFVMQRHRLRRLKVMAADLRGWAGSRPSPSPLAAEGKSEDADA